MTSIEFTLCRFIPASPHQVFDEWLGSTNIMGRRLGHASLVNSGTYPVACQLERKRMIVSGRFLRIERPGLVEHTLMSDTDDIRGRPESLVTVTLESRGGGTILTLRHSNLPDDDMRRRHEKGWELVLRVLAYRLNSKKALRADWN
jgi:uncharacterized protein YndB with AHSA1/START domain